MGTPITPLCFTSDEDALVDFLSVNIWLVMALEVR